MICFHVELRNENVSLEGTTLQNAEKIKYCWNLFPEFRKTRYSGELIIYSNVYRSGWGQR